MMTLIKTIHKNTNSMKDKLLEKFFESERWQTALNKGSLKGINTAVLRDFMSPNGRKKLLVLLVSGNYHIKRPHTALIPKDTPGEFRTVFVNEDEDRIFLSLVNDMLFEIAGDMVHPSCMSYQKGIGCAKIVKQMSEKIDRLSGDDHKVIGWKSDFSKYFDTVPIEDIDAAFDVIEQRFGKSVIINVVREYYHNDNYYDSEAKCETSKYQSLKQGCAVASWLADVVLYQLDKRLTDLGDSYVRYSDDTLYVGPRYEEAMQIMVDELAQKRMKLNPKKVEYLTNDRWFKFLGFSIRGAEISLSKNRIKTFVNEVTARTIKKIRSGAKYETVLHSLQSWLYHGNGEHSWATGVLKTINVKADIDRLNGFVMDCLRAVKVGKSVGMDDIGGLGWSREGKDGCILRGKGSKVRTLRNKTGERLEGYYSLGCMRNNLLFGRDLFDSIVRDL